mgnify:FL=1
MSLQITTITDSIAAISISGVTVKSMSQLKDGWDAYDCPLLCPLPNEFVSAPSVVPVNMGSGTSRKIDFSYTLNYRYFHAPVGTGDITDTWAALVTKAFVIFDAILANDAISGLIDLNLSSISNFGTVNDGANNVYHGFDISFRVLEFVN